MNWNNPLINGFPDQPFISRDNFKLYSINSNYDLMDLNGLSDSDTDQPPQVETVCTVKGKHTNPIKYRQGKLHSRIHSSLTSDQHKKFLELCSKYCHKPPTSLEEQKELNMLKELQEIVAREQNEFMKYLRNFAEVNADNYLFMNKNAEEYLSKFNMLQRKRLMRYPQFYVLLNAVSLAIPNSNHHDFVFHRIAVLLEMGKVPKLVSPNLDKSKCALPCDYRKFKQAFQVDECQQNEFNQDPNIEKLAAEFEADIAMSYSTFECLFDNHYPHFNRQWEMPVTVKKGPKGRKLVMLGDCFITKNMTVPEKSSLFHSLALKSHILHPQHAGYFILETWKENLCKMKECIWDAIDEQEDEDDRRCSSKDGPETLSSNTFDLFDGGSNHLAELEQGVITETLPSQCATRNDCEEEDLSSSESLIIDFPSSPIVSYDGQNDRDVVKPQNSSAQTGMLEHFTNASRLLFSQPVLRPKSQNAARKDGETSSGETASGKVKLHAEPETSIPQISGFSGNAKVRQETKVENHSRDAQKPNCSHDIPHEMPVKACEGFDGPQEGNVFYTMWKIGKLQILLKDSYLGYLKVKKFGYLVEAFAKLEYQVNHGFEQLTLSELARIWLALHIKPAVMQVLLFRIDAFTSEVLKVEKILKQNLNYNFQKCLMQLEIILKTCSELDIGSYLVSHTQGKAHFQIKKSTNKQSGVYNLHLAYNQTETPPAAHETFEKHWMPIDLNVPGRFTPITRIPCTFEPRDLKRTANKKPKK